MAIQQSKSYTKESVQELLHKTRDDKFEVLAVEGLTYNPVTDNIERSQDIQGNGSLALSYTGGDLTGISKTIGSTTYSKTLSYTDGNLTGITAWSAS